LFPVSRTVIAPEMSLILTDQRKWWSRIGDWLRDFRHAALPVGRYRRGDVVLKEGDSCDAVYLVLSGECEARSGLPETARDEKVATLRPGDSFGEKELLTCDVCHSTFRVSSASVLLRLGASHLRNLIESRPRLAGGLLEDRSAPASKSLRLHTGRLITLLSLSEEIPGCATAESLARELHSLTGDSVLLVEFVETDCKISFADFPPAGSKKNGRFAFAAHVEDRDGFGRLRIGSIGAPEDPAVIEGMLAYITARYPCVLLCAGPDTPVTPLLECLLASETAYVFLQQTPEDLYEYTLLTRAIRARAEEFCRRLKPIVWLGAEENAHGLSKWIEQSSGTPIHSFMHNAGRDIRRLAREIGRCRVGLALSSGGARGLAHVGVLQVLEENGIEVDVVAGSSMGAYVAAVWAMGHDGAKMEQLARELESPWGLLHLLDPIVPPRRGFLEARRVQRRLKETIGAAHFYNTVRPVRIVATNLATLERVVFSRGELAAAVSASIAIPGICVPFEIDGETYVDGGIADPLPIDVLREMGVEKVIAVNVIPTIQHVRERLEIERDIARPRRFSVRGWLNQHLNYFAPGNVLDTMMRSIHAAQIRVAEAAARRADIVIYPQSCDGQWHDFTRPGKYIALGRAETEKRLPEIKALLERRPVPDELNHPKIAVAA
jgi:NTE family protein